MKMMGMSIRSTATRFCRSRPLRSGRVTSSTRQLGARTRGRDRNSCADANVSGCQPAERISNSSDSRTETSSSTTNTIGVACDIGDLNSWSTALAKLMYILMGHAPDMAPVGVSESSVGNADSFDRKRLFQRQESLRLARRRRLLRIAAFASFLRFLRQH